MGNVLSGMQNNFNSSGGFEGLLSNPAFQAGIGILEANNAAPGQSTNAISGALRGAQRAGQFKDAASERKAFEEQQELQKKLREQLQQIYGSQAAQGGLPQQQGGLPQQPQGAQLHSPFGQQQAPMQSPLPGQPPNQGTPPGFTSAPGTNAAPGAQDIAALMLQYGTPQQQQAAFQSLSAGERFKSQLAQSEDQFNRRNDLQRELGAARSGRDSRTAQIKNFQFRDSLPDNDRDVFDNLFRRSQFLDLGGGGVQKISPGGERETLITPEEFGQNVGLSDVQKDDLKRRYGEQVALPELRAKSQQAIKTVDSVIDHPGFNQYYGLTSLVPIIPGSDVGSFEAFVNQGQGKVFLEAYESLKGSGQITEVEGAKAEQSIARISNRNQSPADAQKAWEELRSIVKSGLERREKSASTGYGVDGPTVSTQGTTNSGISWSVE